VAIRPQIRIQPEPIDKLIEASAWFCLIMLWVITLYAYYKLPEIIPTHFNASGQADDDGSKMVLFFLPVIGTLLFIGLTALNNYPHIFNYPVAITEQNAERQYANAVRMIRTLKLIIVMVFSILVLLIYHSAINDNGSLGIWFLPVILGFILIPLAYFVYKAVKEK
jgi:uncharacterized membrane protein